MGGLGERGEKKSNPISNTGKQATFSKLTFQFYILCDFEDDDLKTKMKVPENRCGRKSKPWDNEIHYLRVCNIMMCVCAGCASQVAGFWLPVLC